MNNENTTPRKYKRSDAAFKRSAVEHWLSSGQTAEQVAAELGINAQTLKLWKQQQTVVPVPANVPRTLAAVEAENRRLRRELAGVIRQREILKKTLGLISAPSDTGLNESRP
jgi:transposase-like protein